LGHLVVMKNRKENDDIDVEVESLFEEAQVLEWDTVELDQVCFVATVEEAEKHKEAIMAQMDRYYIAELVDGKINGEGHGGEIIECVPEKFGHLVVMKKQWNRVRRSTVKNEEEIKYEAKVIRRCDVDMDNIWYRATSREAEINKDNIVSQMGEWFIAELVDGQIKGSGYGGILTKEDIPEKLGHLVVMKNRKENDDIDVEIESMFEEAQVLEWDSVDLDQVCFVATVEEAEKHKEAIMAQMDRYYIAELVDGKIDGEGHGGEIIECVPEKFGHLVVMKKIYSMDM